MRIALVILNAEPERGGTESYTHGVARLLHARGHEVYMLASRFARSVEPAKQVRLEGAAGGRLQRYRRFNESLQEHLKTTKYDVVHAMLPVSRCDVYHPHAGIEAHNVSEGHRRHEGKILQAISRLTNRLNAKRRVYAEMERKLLEEQRVVVLCLSRAMQQVVDDYYDLDEQQVRTVLHGVDLEMFDPELLEDKRAEVRRQYGLSDGDVAALFMSNNMRLKGLRQTLQAMQKVAREDKRTKLLVIGREDPADYRRLASQLGLEDRVVFGGATTEPAKVHLAADMLVLPTAYDSCGLVILESLAMGRPVITTRMAGASEVMSDGVQGFVVDSQSDVEGLVENWGELMNDTLRARMGDAARELRPELSREKHVERLIEVYQSVLSK